MDGAVISNGGQQPSVTFKAEDNLMSRLKEILIHQEMIEKRLKENRLITDNGSYGSDSKDVIFEKKKESETTFAQVPTVVVDTASDNGQSISSDDLDDSPSNELQKQSNGTTTQVQSYENSTSASSTAKTVKEVLNPKPDNNRGNEMDPNGPKSHFSNFNSTAKTNEIDITQSAVAAVTDDSQKNNDDQDHHHDHHHNNINSSIVTQDTATVKANASQATDKMIDKTTKINATVSEDQVDRVATSEIRKTTFVQQSVSFATNNQLDDCENHLIENRLDELVSEGRGQDDSAFGDSVESISGELCGSESSGRTVSTAASPEPFTLHDENNNELLEPASEIELIIRVSWQFFISINLLSDCKFRDNCFASF